MKVYDCGITCSTKEETLYTAEQVKKAAQGSIFAVNGLDYYVIVVRSDTILIYQKRTGTLDKAVGLLSDTYTYKYLPKAQFCMDIKE